MLGKTKVDKYQTIIRMAERANFPRIALEFLREELEIQKKRSGYQSSFKTKEQEEFEINKNMAFMWALESSEHNRKYTGEEIAREIGMKNYTHQKMTPILKELVQERVIFESGVNEKRQKTYVFR